MRSSTLHITSDTTFDFVEPAVCHIASQLIQKGKRNFPPQMTLIYYFDLGQGSANHLKKVAKGEIHYHILCQVDRLEANVVHGERSVNGDQGE